MEDIKEYLKERKDGQFTICSGNSFHNDDVCGTKLHFLTAEFQNLLSTNHNPFIKPAALSEVHSALHDCTELSMTDPSIISASVSSKPSTVISMAKSFPLTTTPNLKLSQLVNPAHDQNCTEFKSRSI